ncbi:MAG: hypothetical protein QE269_09690 [Fimbriimonas sp.]|nr:hypothetical protein [Fimbriimonas sp.]
MSVYRRLKKGTTEPSAIKDVQLKVEDKETMQSQNTKSVITKKEVETVIEQSFDGLWEQGVLGVRVNVTEEHANIAVYLLRDAEMDQVSQAIQTVSDNLGEDLEVRDTIIRGVIPFNRITTNIAA